MTVPSRDTQLLTALIWAMETKDITQKAVAEEAKLKQPTISRWQREVVEVLVADRDAVTPLKKGSRKAVRGWLDAKGVVYPVPAADLEDIRPWVAEKWEEYQANKGTGVVHIPALRAGSFPKPPAEADKGPSGPNGS